MSVIPETLQVKFDEKCEKPPESKESDSFNVKTELLKTLKGFIVSLVPQFERGSKQILKFFWAIAYLILLVMLIIQVIIITKKYLSFDTTLSSKLIHESRMLFPAVTVCNENPLRRSSIGRIREFNDLILLDDYMMSLVEAFSEGIQGSTDRVTCSEGTFKCEATGICIPFDWVCDGVDNCGEASDELENEFNCTQIEQDRLRNQTELQGICMWPYIQCPNTKYCAMPCDGLPECDGSFDESMTALCPVSMCQFFLDVSNSVGETTSIDYPNTYAPNLDCIWHFTAPTSENIQILFLDIQIEGNPGNCFDYLELFDGNSEEDERIEIGGFTELCGYSVPDPNVYTSSGSSFLLKFKTNSLWNMRGFKISYATVPRIKRRNVDSDNIGINETSIGLKSVSRGKREAVQPIDSNSFYALKNFNEIEYGSLFNIYRASQLKHRTFRSTLSIAQDIFKWNGYQIDDFVVECTFNGVSCDSSYFAEYQDFSHGNCFIFNPSLGANESFPFDGRYSSKNGRENGLELTLFLDSENYLGLLAPLVGARLAIQDREIFPHVRDFGLAIAAGQVTFIKIHKHKTLKLDGKFSNCSNDWPHFLRLNQDRKESLRYDKYSCEYFCTQIEMAKRCGCTDGFDFGFSLDEDVNEASKLYCQPINSTQRDCVAEVYDDYENNRIKCLCPETCLKTNYNEQESKAPYPSKQYAPSFALKLLGTKSKVLLPYLQNLLSAENLSEEMLQESFQRNFARVEIYYDSLSFDYVEETPAYDIASLIADFGANLGFWLGWTAVILFELGQLLYELFEIAVKRHIIYPAKYQ